MVEDEHVDVVPLHDGEIITLVEQDDNIVLPQGHIELIKLVGDMGVLLFLDRRLIEEVVEIVPVFESLACLDKLVQIDSDGNVVEEEHLVSDVQHELFHDEGLPELPSVELDKKEGIFSTQLRTAS